MSVTYMLKMSLRLINVATSYKQLKTAVNRNVHSCLSFDVCCLFLHQSISMKFSARI